jgi:uncharacterized damage-inducible protein DinB
MTRPVPAEYPVHFENYINLIKREDIVHVLTEQVNEIQAFIAAIPAEKESYAYAEKKWTIKQVIAHLIDIERIMAYRALCFARKDKTLLPGFDENLFADNNDAAYRTLKDLAQEFTLVRESNLALFKHFDEETLRERGNANGKECSVRALLFVIAGHALHHMNVIKARYLVNPN